MALARRFEKVRFWRERKKQTTRLLLHWRRDPMRHTPETVLGHFARESTLEMGKRKDQT